MNTRIDIVKPCSANWATMDGDNRRRLCSQCDKHVHDLSAMREAEAEQVVQQAADRICVRYRTDASGKILHRTARSSRLARFAFAAVGVVAAVPALASGKVEAGNGWAWIAEIFEALTPEPPSYPIMGEMVARLDPRAVTNLTDQPLTLTCAGPSIEAAVGERAEAEGWEGSSCTVTSEAGTAVFNEAEVVYRIDGNAHVCGSGR